MSNKNIEIRSFYYKIIIFKNMQLLQSVELRILQILQKSHK